MTGRSKLLAQRCERVWVTGAGNCPVWIMNFGKWLVGDQVKVVQFERAAFSLQQYGKYTESSLCLFTCLRPSPSELGSRRTRRPFNRDGQTCKQTTKREIQNQQTNKRDEMRGGWVCPRWAETEQPIWCYSWTLNCSLYATRWGYREQRTLENSDWTRNPFTWRLDSAVQLCNTWLFSTTLWFVCLCLVMAAPHVALTHPRAAEDTTLADPCIPDLEPHSTLCTLSPLSGFLHASMAPVAR